MIDEYLVLIKIGCPYSENAISLLKEKKQKHHVIDYFKLSKKMKENVNELIKSLNKNKEYNYYPKIFKNEKFIGGYDKLSKILIK